MNKDYQITQKNDSIKIKSFLEANSDALLPMVELVEQSQIAIDELIETLCKSTIETILQISASNIAGERRQGSKSNSSIGWHGSQRGYVCLDNRKLNIQKPRLRDKKAGKNGQEVCIPAYEAMKSERGLIGYIFNAMMRGVSTRNYEKILPDACACVGVSKSSISRRFLLASEEECRKFLDRRFDDTRILVIFIDGIVVGEHTVIAALGIDENGYKHVLGITEGATENATVVKDLLENLVERGIKPGLKRLFVIDGSKALRSAIDAIYGNDNPVQRCRLHKARNIENHLPNHLKEMARLTIKAAWKLEPKEGQARLRQLASMLKNNYPSAAASIHEGLEEMFTVNKLGVPNILRKCLVTTNIIESPNSAARTKIRRVTNWKDGNMVKRWVTSGFIVAEQSFRRVRGFKDIWILRAALDEIVDKKEIVA